MAFSVNSGAESPGNLSAMVTLANHGQKMQFPEAVDLLTMVRGGSGYGSAMWDIFRPV